jgi:hypothetical protein
MTSPAALEVSISDTKGKSSRVLDGLVMRFLIKLKISFAYFLYKGNL